MRAFGDRLRNTLAKANKIRNWRIYGDFAQILIDHVRKLYAHDQLQVDLKQTAYAFDSTTIDLCLTLFPWAKFRRRKAAVKLHTLIDLRGNIPSFIHISTGKTHDVNALDHLPIEAGAFYMMDRGYIDFGRLHRFQTNMAFFVTRAKKNLQFRRVARRCVDKTTGLRCDQTIVLTGVDTSTEYPAQLRRIKYVDPDTGKRFVFLTNNFVLDALTIAKLYVPYPALVAFCDECSRIAIQAANLLLHREFGKISPFGTYLAPRSWLNQSYPAFTPPIQVKWRRA